MISKKKRIHILQIVGDPVGGIRKHVHSIIKRLDSQAFEQSYVFSSVARDKTFIKEIELLRPALVFSISLKIIKRPCFSDIFNILILIFYCRKKGVNLLHGHGAKGGLYARLVGFFCRIPSVYTPHGGVVHNMFRSFEKRLYITIEKLLVMITDFYIFESKYTADSFISNISSLKDNWLINFNGIDFTSIIPTQISKTSCNHLDIGVFGVLRREKGQIFLINAVARLNKVNNINVKLHIFGEGVDKNILSDRVLELGLQNGIFFYGDVSNPLEKMNEMDLIVIPSLYESFGFVGLESACLGKPLIVTGVGGLLDIFNEDTAYIVKPSDEDALANGILEFVNNPKPFKTRAIRARRFCSKNFSIDKMIDGLSITYSSIGRGNKNE